MNQVTINPYIFVAILGALFIAFCLVIVFYRGMQYYRRESNGLLSQLKNNIERLNEASSKIVSLEKTIEQKEYPEKKTSDKFTHVLKIGYYGTSTRDLCCIESESETIPPEFKYVIDWLSSNGSEPHTMRYKESTTGLNAVQVFLRGSISSFKYMVDQS